MRLWLTTVSLMYLTETRPHAFYLVDICRNFYNHPENFADIEISCYPIYQLFGVLVTQRPNVLSFLVFLLHFY